MKHIFALLMLCLIAALMTGCASSHADDSAILPTAEPLVIDLDLSTLSGTVVYSQVYNIMYTPDEYLGKVIKMSGYYSAYEDSTTGIVYHACIIPDATACCTQGIEFVWAGEHTWPDDYPEDGTEIVVTGRLESYIEEGYLYLHLVDAEVVWK